MASYCQWQATSWNQRIARHVPHHNSSLKHCNGPWCWSTLLQTIDYFLECWSVFTPEMNKIYWKLQYHLVSYSVYTATCTTATAGQRVESNTTYHYNELHILMRQLTSVLYYIHALMQFRSVTMQGGHTQNANQQESEYKHSLTFRVWRYTHSQCIRL